MSFIAAVLILNLEEADAFITFANLLNKPCQMAFFRVDHELVQTHTELTVWLFVCSRHFNLPPFLFLLSVGQMLKYFAAFEVFFEENLPRLFSHFQTNNLTPDLYLIDWWVIKHSAGGPAGTICSVWSKVHSASAFRVRPPPLCLLNNILSSCRGVLFSPSGNHRYVLCKHELNESGCRLSFPLKAGRDDSWLSCTGKVVKWQKLLRQAIKTTN